jgi:hypothetical protein
VKCKISGLIGFGKADSIKYYEIVILYMKKTRAMEE